MCGTYSNVVRTFDAQQVTQVLNDMLIRVGAMRRGGEHPSRPGSQAEGEQQAHVALDGKTLRGTLGHAAADQQKMHQLTLYDTQTGVLLKEQVTGEKQNELSIVSAFLTPVLVKGLSSQLMPCIPSMPSVSCHAASMATMCSSPRTISPR